MSDMLDIPDFLRREPTTAPTEAPMHRRRQRKIPYPRDGYKCVGMRAKARARHKEKLRRKWERKLVIR